MTRSSRFALLAQSLMYVATGINHFWHTPFYTGIMPDHYSHPEALVKFSGAAEILGGVGLALPGFRRASAFGLTVMLLGFLDVHIYMLRHSERFPNLPRWVLWARLPAQALLIAWALQYARKTKSNL